MKVKVRRTKGGERGYELYDESADAAIASDLAAHEIYARFLAPQLQGIQKSIQAITALLPAIGNQIAAADANFDEDTAIEIETED
jgi:hypothetical protein